MPRGWAWETEDAEFTVEFDERAGVVRWRGQDKPRKGGANTNEPDGGLAEQTASELRSTGQPSFICPPEILARVLSALGPVKKKVPPVEPASIEGVVGFCQAALRKLTGARENAAVTKVELSVEEVPDDRPTQTPGTRIVTDVHLGPRVLFTCVEEVGGFFQGSAAWSAPDFAGTGPLRLSFERDGVELEGAPEVVDLFATLFRAPRPR